MSATDPLDLARRLVEEAPGGPGGAPQQLELEGLRWLSDEGADAETVAAFRDHLATLTGVRTASTTHEPLEPVAAASPDADPTDAALDLVAQAFSAPFDGSDARLLALADRARTLCAPLVQRGADPQRIEALIALESADLRHAWTARARESDSS